MYRYPGLETIEVTCEIAIEKLKNIYVLKKNHQPIIGIFDLDGTLSAKKIQWNEIVKLLPKDIQKINEDIDRKYMEKHIRGHLTAEEEKAWVMEKIYLFQQMQVTEKLIKKAAASLKPRHYSNELMQIYEESFVISMGIKLMIKEFLKLHGLKAGVFACDFVFDSSGAMYGCEPETIVYPPIKGGIVVGICNDKNIPLKNVTVFGDSKGDESMYLPETFNVLVGPNGYGIRNIDICLRSNSFKPIVNLLLADKDDFNNMIEILRRKKIRVY